MYYTKKFKDEKDKVVPKYNACGILRVLNYFPFINARNVELLSKSMDEPEWVDTFCDMSAAAITQRHYRDMINLELVWGTVSSFFHQAIQMRAFSAIPSPENEFKYENKNDYQVETLVAGTQAPEVYRARVDGSIKILRNTLPPKCRITFPGANPAKSMERMGLQGGVATLNEAADMELYYRKHVEKKPLSNRIDVTLSRESESDTTDKNIENFFKNVNLSKEKENHVYIVSSLFHLPRFIDLTIARIVAENIPVSELTFVSAEDPMDSPSEAVGTSEYLKSCMFEFFKLLYKDTPKDQIFKPAQKPV